MYLAIRPVKFRCQPIHKANIMMFQYIAFVVAIPDHHDVARIRFVERSIILNDCVKIIITLQERLQVIVIGARVVLALHGIKRVATEKDKRISVHCFIEMRLFQLAVTIRAVVVLIRAKHYVLLPASPDTIQPYG
jgi:hypothetical protein